MACFAAALLALLAAFLLLQIRLQTMQKQRMLEAEQRCRLKLYRQFYANPLHLLHRSSLGGNLENFSNDLVTDRSGDHLGDEDGHEDAVRDMGEVHPQGEPLHSPQLISSSRPFRASC